MRLYGGPPRTAATCSSMRCPAGTGARPAHVGRRRSSSVGISAQDDHRLRSCLTPEQVTTPVGGRLVGIVVRYRRMSFPVVLLSTSRRLWPLLSAGIAPFADSLLTHAPWGRLLSCTVAEWNAHS